MACPEVVDSQDRALVPVICSLSAALGPLAFGFSVGYPSPTTQEISEAITMTDEQIALFKSLVTLGALCGSFFAGKFSDAIGRRFAITLSAVPFLAGYILLVFAYSVSMLFAARILSGIGVGLVSVICPVYIVEIAPTRLRGGLGSLGQLAVTLGTFAVYILGLGIGFRWLAAVGAVIPTVMAVLILFAPESPRWLVAKGRVDDARLALVRLRGTGRDIRGELSDMQQGSREVGTSGVRMLISPVFLKPLVVGVILMIYQQFTGINAIISNASSVFQGADIPHADLVSALAVGIVQVIGTLVCVLLMDRLGRRLLLIAGGIGTCISALILGVFFYAHDVHHNDSIGAVAVTALVVYVLAYGFGSGAPPWVLMSEMFSSRTRGMAASIITLSNWLSAFIVIDTFSAMQSAFTYAGLFWFYSGVCLCGTLFIVFCVPETKGKTMEEIVQFFVKGVRYDKQLQEEQSVLSPLISNMNPSV